MINTKSKNRKIGKSLQGKEMNNIMIKGILLSTVLLFSISLVIFPSNVYAEVEVKNTSLEETTILEITNNSNENIKSFKVWIGTEFNFKGFKTEAGWVGEKSPQGFIVFSSKDVLKIGESVKIGVQTDKIVSGISWKATSEKNIEINKGKASPKELPTVFKNPNGNPIPQSSEGSIKTESIFRIIPEKPNVGSSIRVTGDQFGANQEFDFYIDSKKIGSFVTDENGNFMTTMKIPETQKADRVDFKVKNKVGDEKSISLRIGEIDNRIPESDNIKLTIQGIPNVVHRGDLLEISGTGAPNSAVTAEIKTSDGKIINSRTAEVDPKGNWKISEAVLIPLDTPFGKYSATITDGRQNIQKQWTVESDKVILISPKSIKFTKGETMEFNGTALSNKIIEFSLKDPRQKEIFSEILTTDENGFIEFKYETNQNTEPGTYTLVATQEKEKEFIFAGLDVKPIIPIIVEFDKLNYKQTESAIVSLIGESSEIVKLFIIDPSDKQIGEDISITLEPDGSGKYILDLEGFGSGVYTAVASKGNSKSSEIFTVGLQTGSGEIEIKHIKPEGYIPGDIVLILGDSGPNALLSLTLSDPEGNEIKTKETFSDKDGKISDNSFRIPSNAESGIWNIKAQSGSNFDIIELDVLETIEEGITIDISEIEKLDGVNDYITFTISGVAQTTEITISDSNGKIIERTEFPASGGGKINQPWALPEDIVPGTYTIKVSDAKSFAETTFVIE